MLDMSTRMRWAGNVARKGERRGAKRFWWGSLREKRDHLKDQRVDRRIILNWIFRKWDGGIDWIDLAQNRDMWRASSCKCGNEPSGSIKFGEFLN
jgi:hypothetical protein